MTANGLAAAAGWTIDRLAGEPPARWHPVAWFGKVMAATERRIYRDHRGAGVAHLAIGVALALGAAGLLRRLLGRELATLAATTVAVAGKMLTEEACTVLAALDVDDVAAARQRVAMLVGRDVSAAGADEITRAVIETTAENTVDAVTAPLFWATVGGAPGVLVHRAINTLDAMVGHRSERYRRFGWAAARADDVLNWPAARITAAATMVAAPHRARDVARTIRRDAPRHPSPNGGVIEAAFAAALGVRLGGVNRYGDTVEDRGGLGDGPCPAVADGWRAVRLARRTGTIVAITCIAATVRHPATGIVARRRADSIRAT